MPTIKGTVKSQTDKTPLTSGEVELLFRLKGITIKTLKASVNGDGWFQITFDTNILPEITKTKTIIVLAQVLRNGTEVIPVVNNPYITNLAEKDYELDVLVNLPTVITGRIFGVVRSLSDSTVLPGVTVELLFQRGEGIDATLNATADTNGRYEIHFDKNVITPLWQFHDIFVLAKVRRNETESIPVTNNPLITNLEVRDYNVDLLVALPAATTGRLTGFVRSATDQTIVPGIGVRITFSKRAAVGAPPAQLLTTEAWTTPHGYYELVLDVARLPFLREPNIVVTTEVWRDDMERIPSTPVEPLPITGLRDYRRNIEVQLAHATGSLSVSGRVTDAGGVAAAGLTVIAVDRDMRREEPLGSTTTDGDGRYRISYSATQFTRAEKGSADLVVRVMGADGKTVLGVSPVRFNAQPQETIDIQLEDSTFRGLSEYERHLAIMRPVMEDVALSGLTDSDLDFLTGETGIPIAQLEAIRLDAQWREQNSTRALPAAVFYGLLRQGLPKTLPTLLRQGTQRWREALIQSLANNSIPQTLRPQVDEIIQTLIALAVDHTFVPAPDSDGEGQSVGVLLAASGLPPEQSRLIAKTSLTLAQNVDEATWTKTLLEAGVSQPAVNSARFAIQAHTLFDKHMPTLVQLQQTVAKTYASVADLAQLSRTQWLAVAKGLETKKQLPKGFADAATYGQSLANGVEALFPTKVLAHHLTTTAQPARQAVGQFILANPSFDLLHSPVDSFVATAKMDGIKVPPEALKAQLGKEARLSRLIPIGDRTTVTDHLLDKGFDSAAKIAALGRKQFINTMSQSIGSLRAEGIYHNASERTSELFLRAIQMNELFNPGSSKLPGTMPAPSGELATWAAMFGHGNGCSCSPCESAHGPAAYLVDLFEFLKDKDADGVGDSRKTLLEILLQRRPDLQHLLLNCANAETPLPYIDLVIELLERLAVDPDAPLNYDEGTTPQTPETVPDVENVASYLRAVPHAEPKETPKAVYPWNLPFDRHYLETGVYFNALGMRQADVLELKATAGDDLHRARLGLSPRVWTRLHNTKDILANVIAGRWGLERLVVHDGPRLDKLAGKDGVLLARSGLPIEELFALIESPLFAKWNIAINRSPGETDDPCNIEHAQVQVRVGESKWADLGINEQIEVFDLMHRVLRLRLALNWPLSRLLQALHALGVGRNDRRIDLVALSRLVWLSSQLGVSVEHLSALLIALERQPADDMVRKHAEQAWLAMLKLSPEDHAHLRTLGLEDTFATKLEDPPGTPRPGPVRLERLERVQATIELLRAADLDPAELRYLLRDEDLVPSVFTPRDKDLNTHLESVVAAIQNVGMDPPPIPALRADAAAAEREQHQKTIEARDEAVAELGRLRVRAVEERLGEITGATWINHVIHEGTAATLLAPAVVQSFITLAATPKTPDAEAYDGHKQIARRSLRQILKAARLLVMLKATSEDVEALTRLTRDNTIWLDFNTLPLSPPTADGPSLNLSRIMELMRASVVQAVMPKADQQLLDIIASPLSEEQAIAALETITAWGRSLSVKRDEGIHALRELVVTLGLDRTNWWRLPSALARLHHAVRWLQQRRIKVVPDRNELKVLLDAAVFTESPESNPITALRNLARSRFARERDYYSAVTPAMDQLRMAHRDALLAHILHANKRKPRWTTADDVYAHLLIDVQMGPCQLTSRIVQAHSTVQLFVQRCLMNLETMSGVSLGNVSNIAEWRQWDWMKNYRVWEAARKVFLYPENWIEPDLRDVKSSFFEDLENELLQDEITSDKAERAIRGYLTKFHEVARLDIRALYEEEYTEPLGKGETATRRVIHMVGRTHAVPHIYYYRKRLNDLTWTPWEKIELSIDSDLLALVVHNKRPMLFWLQFKEVQQGRTDPPRTAWEVRLSWSVRDQGRWEAPRTSLEFLGDSRLPAVLQISQTGIDLEASLYSLATNPYNSISQLGNVFYLQNCWGKITTRRLADTAAWSNSMVPPAGTTFFENKLFSRNATPSPLFLAVRPHQPYTQDKAFTILASAGARFEITPTYQYPWVGVFQPFVYADDERQFLTTSRQANWSLVESLFFLGVPGSHPSSRFVYRFETFYHPYSCLMLKTMDEAWVAGLYRAPDRLDQQMAYSGRPPERFPRQLIHEGARTFEDKYMPTWSVWRDETKAPFVYPIEEFDFTATGAYSLYNWEVFFHVPLLFADRLSKAGKYQDAQQWFHSIFDPTDVSSHGSPQKYWRVKPLFEEAVRWHGPAESLEAMLRKISLDSEGEKSQVEAWRNDPFNPHLLARIRLVSYMKTVVQKYIENLISWADSLFRRDTIESINEATQLYVLASEILGPAPTMLPPMTRTGRSYVDLHTETTIDAFANGLGRFENAMPVTSGHASTTGPLAPGLSMLYFCIPSNPRLRELRTTIDDRLFKIRHCMDIDGRTRQLALFAPPIDPALLVRARASGLEIGTALDMAFSGRQSPYRFQPLLQKALEFTSEVRAFGGALLNALEKRDGEQLSQLRARHEVALLKLVSEVRRQQIDEAEKQLEAARQSRTQAEARLEFYTSRVLLSSEERGQIDRLNEAHNYQQLADVFSLTASVLYATPDWTIGTNSGVTWGGTNVGNALRAVSGSLSLVASESTYQANMSGIMAGHRRRQDDWDLQAGLAQKERDQIQQQIYAAEIRVAIAKQEQRNHEQQIVQAEQSEAFLRDKFTNAQLYNWMSAQLSALHYQAYRMAFDLAKQAEAAAQREVDTPNNIIRFDHWDSGRKGLLAGERLGQDLRRLEVAYMQENTRRFELTTHVSLRRLNAIELLKLRNDGRCAFEIPREVFDLDFSEHDNRRIKSVSISVPGVVGPYVGVHGVLKLVRPTDFIASSTTIATSSGQNDAGVFQLDFRDERYLPFEGVALDGGTTWEFTLPGTRTFDYNTISDVILHIQYTAKEAVPTGGTGPSTPPLVAMPPGTRLQLLDVRHDFPEAWRRLREGSRSERVALRDELFPYFVRSGSLTGLKLHRDPEGGGAPIGREFEVTTGDLDGPWKGLLVVEYTL